MKPLPADIEKSLTFFDVSGDVDLDLFPTFLIAGPQRTGSTWIYTQIEDHPQIQLTHPKEVYFFNLLRKTDHPQHWTDDLCEYLKQFEVSDTIRATREETCQRLFGCSFDPRARGDATASYAAGIDDARMAEILRLCPDLRVIITVRNPIERAWSHVKLIVERKHGRGQVAEEPPEQIEKMLQWDYNAACGYYTQMHDRWSKRLQQGHLFFRAFDEISSQPREFLLDVLRFLEVDDDPRFLRREAMAGSNATRSPSRIPARFAGLLREMYLDEIERLRERFGIGTEWHLHD
jgi:hypothetical protein